MTFDGDWKLVTCGWEREEGEDGNGDSPSFDTSHVVHLGPPICHAKAIIAEYWSKMPVHEKHMSARLMRLHTYWMPLLLDLDPMHDTFKWALRCGVLNPSDPTHVSKKTLTKLETLEAILYSLDEAWYAEEKIFHLLFIAISFREHLPEALEDAQLFLREEENPRLAFLGNKRVRYAVLSYMFVEIVSFMADMVCDTSRIKDWLLLNPSEPAVVESNSLKNGGNLLFQEEKYQQAVVEYSKAIKKNPQNHIAFSNRALCYTRSQQFLEAACDAKRAILIEPLWVKGHYRYCEALFLLGEVEWALSSNNFAQALLCSDPGGVKDLEQQCDRFKAALRESTGCSKAEPPKKKKSTVDKPKKKQKPTKAEDTNKSTVVETQQLSGKGNNTTNNNDKCNDACKAATGTMSKMNQAVNDKTAATKEPLKTQKKKPTASKDHAHVTPDRNQLAEESMRHVMTSAHSYLIRECYYKADTFFTQALDLLDSFTADEKKKLGFSALDMQLVLYGRVSALTEIGKPQELSEARKLLKKIQSYEERLFQGLVHYAYGRIYLKEKRFATALEHFQDSLQMLRNQITPGKLTWPQTDQIVKETETDCFKELLEESIDCCKFPPLPDGTCRFNGCLGPSKNIYITEPDFKGFVEFKCSQKCLIQYHNACWKACKPSSFDKSPKPCSTPDCSGTIDSIKYIDATGLVKQIVPTGRRAESPRKPKVNQKPPACVKKSKEKNQCKSENNKNNNKQQMSENKTTAVSDDISQQKNNSPAPTQPNAWLLYQDRILVQVSQMMQLLRQEKALAASDVSACLKPWLELDSAWGNQLAAKMLNWEQERLETLDQAAELLLQRKNRVWARIFIHLLSNTSNINAELGRWAGRLNDADLKAAKSFVERNAEHLDNVDLAPLVTFAPFKEIISEYCTHDSNFVSRNVTKHIKKAPPHQMRLFIWTLEEHKDIYISFNILLDEYFVNMIGGHFSVLKKSGNPNSFPAGDKGRGRKKKKDPKILQTFFGSENDAADEWAQEDPIFFPDPNEPFSIPVHLRGQVADFEERYNGAGHARHYSQVLDDNPDPAVENLYDYFAQIFEEHGPLPPDDPLLHGEMANFPPEARVKIRQAGGFMSFLLESTRFVNIGSRVGLAKHAVALRQATRPQSPRIVSPGPNITLDAGKDPSDGSDHDNLSPDDFRSLDLYTCEVDETWELCSYGSNLSSTRPEVDVKKHAETQTYQGVKKCVAVNTEPLRPYEDIQGGINKRVEIIQRLQVEMSKMEEDRKALDLEHKETLASLEKDIQEISTNINITDKEMSMFQQKLEEEVKKDQKEKKANQETLKALKMETAKLVEERDSLAKQIRTNQASYDDKFNKFLELSHQAAAERMSLEDEINRCKKSIAAATRRSLSAQLSKLESSRDQRMYGLHVRLADAKTLLAKLDEHVPWYPSLDANRHNVRAKVQELEQKIAAAEILYKQQVEQVKSGQRVQDVLSRDRADLRVSPLSSDLDALSIVDTPPVPAASAQAAENPARLAQAGNTMFERAVDSLGAIFPEYTRSDFMKFFKDLRSANGGTLGCWSLQEVVSGVSQLILDQKEAVASGAKSKTTRLGDAATPPLVDPPSVWQKSVSQTPVSSSPLNLEDDCIICQEEMSPPDCLVLECRHTFHKKCITSWLKEKTTCPTCRKDTMFSDFPLLPGRRRQAP
ncbi:E3 ubiquitin-protein ligase TTC3 [Syngnathus acus]|uniref:E3 ubiquitin-protein ligase TTC3 n=1 Tax=Syngnathus acus TaxID=161584 RepID=UPI001885F65E|nr:E3 ubiquitin-protein ligase TTC3 [Syngnathus acus]